MNLERLTFCGRGRRCGLPRRTLPVPRWPGPELSGCCCFRPGPETRDYNSPRYPPSGMNCHQMNARPPIKSSHSHPGAREVTAPVKSPSIWGMLLYSGSRGMVVVHHGHLLERVPKRCRPGPFRPIFARDTRRHLVAKDVILSWFATQVPREERLEKPPRAYQELAFWAGNGTGRHPARRRSAFDWPSAIIDFDCGVGDTCRETRTRCSRSDPQAAAALRSMPASLISSGPIIRCFARQRPAQSDPDPQFREHGHQALCRQSAGSAVPGTAVAPDRHGLRPRSAGNSPEDCPSRGPDDPGRTAQGAGRFLAEVCARLGLGDIEVYAHKLGSSYSGQVSGVISRAVGEIPETLDRVAACLATGGRMIFMKGPECDAEIARAQQEDSGAFPAGRGPRLRDSGHAPPSAGWLFTGGSKRGWRATAARRDGCLLRRSGARGFQRVEPELSAFSRPAHRARCSQARTGVACRLSDRLRGPGSLSRPGPGWISDESGSPPPSGRPDVVPPGEAAFSGSRRGGDERSVALSQRASFLRLGRRGAVARGLHALHPVPGPGERGSRLSARPRRSGSRDGLAQGGGPSLSSPEQPRGRLGDSCQVPLFQGPSIQDLESRTVPIIALDTSGPEVGESSFPQTFGLLVGIEGPGLPDRWRQGPRRRVAIVPEVESLNAATAAAIALYVWAMQTARNRWETPE